MSTNGFPFCLENLQNPCRNEVQEVVCPLPPDLKAESKP